MPSNVAFSGAPLAARPLQGMVGRRVAACKCVPLVGGLGFLFRDEPNKAGFLRSPIGHCNRILQMQDAKAIKRMQ